MALLSLAAAYLVDGMRPPSSVVQHDPCPHILAAIQWRGSSWFRRRSCLDSDFTSFKSPISLCKSLTDSLFGYPMDDTSLSTALQECSSEKECHAVYDYECQKYGQMKHCHTHPKLEFSAGSPSPSSSCVLIKHRGKNFQILAMFVSHILDLLYAKIYFVNLKLPLILKSLRLLKD